MAAETFRGDYLKSLREGKGWTQDDVAQALREDSPETIKATKQSVTMWETCVTSPSFVSLMALARVFGVEAGSFEVERDEKKG